jgi:hypothetical protein
MDERRIGRVVPPDPPPQFWLTKQNRAVLEPLDAKREAGGVLTDQEWVTYCRLRGREDLYFFAKYCCGFDWLEAELHAPLAWVWQRPNTFGVADGVHYSSTRLALLPRSHLKTTLCTQAWALWMLVRNPEERGLIYTHSFSFAKKLMAPIKARLEGKGPLGQFFLACFGEIVPGKQEREKWTETMITLRREGAYTDVSLEATGVGAAVTGGHFTFQAIDDLQDKKETREQIEKIIEDYNNLTPMLLPRGQRRIVATRWGWYDHSAYVMRHFQHVVVAKREWIENGHYIFSRIKDMEDEILALKRRDGFLHSCWYLNQPRDDAKGGWRRSWVRRFRRSGQDIEALDRDGKVERTIPLATCNVFVFIDPNTGDPPGGARDQNARSEQDYVGLIVLAVASDHRRYVLRAMRARWGVDEFVRAVFQIVAYWHPQWVAIEQVSFARLFVPIFQMHFLQGKPPFTIIPWPGGRASKRERITGLDDFYSNGMIYHLDEDATGGTEALESELEDGESAEYDDLSDALSAHLKLVYAPGERQSQALPKPWKLEEELMAHLDPTSARVWASVERKAEEERWGGREFWRDN